jgi:hypothetical protein
MPLPRKKDAGSSGAPFTVTRKSDGATFTLDPQFKCSVEVVDDGQGGDDNGAKFYESFRYKLNKIGEWINQDNSKLGMLTEVVKPGYFDDESIPDLSEDDLEGFEMMCRIKPKKNPGGSTTGSTIEWDTMRALPSKKVAAAAAEEEDDVENIPF